MMILDNRNICIYNSNRENPLIACPQIILVTNRALIIQLKKLLTPVGYTAKIVRNMIFRITEMYLHTCIRIFITISKYLCANFFRHLHIHSAHILSIYLLYSLYPCWKLLKERYLFKI